MKMPQPTWIWILLVEKKGNVIDEGSAFAVKMVSTYQMQEI